MKINLLRGSVIYGSVTIFSRIASIILIPILTRLLSPLEYGALSMMLTIVQLINFLATLEVAQAVTLFFTDRNLNNRDLYPSTAIRFSLSMYILLLVIIAIFGEFIAGMFGKGTIGSTLILAGTMLMAANGLFFFIQNQLRLEFKSRWYAALTLGFVVLTSCGAVIGAIYYTQPTEGVIFGQAAGAFIVSIIGMIILWKRLNTGFSVIKLKQMLKFSLPLVPAGLLLIAGQHVAKFILGIYGNLEDVGIFGLAYQIAGFSGLAILGVQTAITPSILANHHQNETPKMLGRLFDIFTIVSLIFCSFLSVFSHELVLIFSTPSYIRAADLVPFFAFAIALNGLYIFFPGKIIKGKSVKQLSASIGSFLTALGTGFILIRMDGVRGASLSVLFSSAVFFFIWCYISQKLYHLPIKWFKLLKSTVLAAIVCTVGLYLIPSGIIVYALIMKCILLLLFACVIGWNYLLEIWNKYILKNKV